MPNEWPAFQNLPQNVKYKILTYFYEKDNKLGWSQMACNDETIRKLIIKFRPEIRLRSKLNGPRYKSGRFSLIPEDRPL